MTKLELEVHNVGRYIAVLNVDLSASDKYFDHNVVISIDPGACQLGHGGLVCGSLKEDERRTITVFASPKDAGNFRYSVYLVELWNGQVQEINGPDGKNLRLEFRQAVLPK